MRTALGNFPFYHIHGLETHCLIKDFAKNAAFSQTLTNGREISFQHASHHVKSDYIIQTSGRAEELGIGMRARDICYLGCAGTPDYGLNLGYLSPALENTPDCDRWAGLAK